MPYKTGKMKGELTTAEIRSLVRAHNKASKIVIPTGSSRDGIIKLLASKGFRVDHKNQKLIQSAQAQKQLTIQEAKKINKPKPQTALQKQKVMERKQKKEAEEKKKTRQIRKKAVDDEKARQKKKAPVKKKTTSVSTQTSSTTTTTSTKPDPKLKTEFLKLLDQNKSLIGPNIYKQFRGDADKPKAQFKDLLPRLRYVITRAKQDKTKSGPKKDLTPSATKGFIRDGVVIIPNPVRAVNPRAPETLRIKTAKQYSGTIDKLERLDGTYDEQSKNLLFKKVLDSIKSDRIIRLVNSLNVKEKPDTSKKGRVVKPSQSKLLQLKGPGSVPPPKIKSAGATMKIKPIKLTDTTGLLSTEQYADIRNIPAKDIYDNLVNNRSPMFFPFTSFTRSSMIPLAYILDQNKNDCSLPMNVLEGINTFQESSGNINPNVNLVGLAKDIADSIIRCWKSGKKVVCIPITISPSGGRGNVNHANMLIFNTYRQEAEHFEPHGDQFHGTGKWVNGEYVYKKVRGANLRNGVAEINRELLKDPEWTELFGKKKFKYLQPADICPANIKQLKSFQTRDKYRTNKTREFNGVVITETGGYCQLWSFFYMDLRLKSLRKSSKEVYTEMANLFKANYDDKSIVFITLMRGMSRFAWETQLQMVKKGLISKDLLLKVMNFGRGEKEGSLPFPTSQELNKYKVAVAEFLKPFFGRATSSKKTQFP